jgi:hypothetical protein
MRTLSPRCILSAGNEWAKSAQRLILAELGSISVKNLMVSLSRFLWPFITSLHSALVLNLEKLIQSLGCNPAPRL